jgi:hypothetical protein
LSDNKVFLIDFRNARRFDDYGCVKVTGLDIPRDKYCPPELHAVSFKSKCSIDAVKAEVFSLGVTIWEICGGDMPAEFYGLLNKMTQMDPHHRPNLRYCLQTIEELIKDCKTRQQSHS